MFRTLIRRYTAAYEGLPRTAWLLALAMLVNRSGSMVLFFLSLYITESLGYTIVEAGFMLSAYGGGSMLGAFLGGALTDRYGAFRIQVLSLLLNAVCLMLLPLFQDLFLLGVMLFITATIGESFRPANSTAVARVCPPEIRTRGFGLNRLAINLGVTIGPTIGGVLASLDYDLLFIADGITCALAGILIWFLFIHRTPELIPLEELPHSSTAPAPWSDRIFLFFLVLIFCSAVVFSQLFSTWPIYLGEVYEISKVRIGLLVGLNALLVVVIEMPLLHAIENRNVPLVMLTGALLIATGFAMLPLSTGLVYAAVTVVIWTMGEILLFPTAGAFAANRAKNENRGRYMGLFTFAFSFAIVVSPQISTYIYQEIGSAQLWGFCGVVGGLTVGGFYALYRMIIVENAHTRRN